MFAGDRNSFHTHTILPREDFTCGSSIHWLFRTSRYSIARLASSWRDELRQSSRWQLHCLSKGVLRLNPLKKINKHWKLKGMQVKDPIMGIRCV